MESDRTGCTKSIENVLKGKRNRETDTPKRYTSVLKQYLCRAIYVTLVMKWDDKVLII